jgi:hypothetical protein
MASEVSGRSRISSWKRPSSQWCQLNIAKAQFSDVFRRAGEFARRTSQSALIRSQLSRARFHRHWKQWHSFCRLPIEVSSPIY